MLQHVWAELEHDRGYKKRAQLPNAIRRRFARLASVLELADDEFMAVRDALNQTDATRVTCRAEGLTEALRDIIIRPSDLPPDLLRADAYEFQLFVNVDITNPITNENGLTDIRVIVGDLVLKDVRLAGPNSVRFTVSADIVRRGSKLVEFRIVGVRVNASRLGVALTLRPALVQASLTIRCDNTEARVLFGSELARVLLAAAVDVEGPDGQSSFPLVFSRTQLATLASNGDAVLGQPFAKLHWGEKFERAFRTQSEESGVANSRADCGTRLMARISNMPDGVDILVSTTEIWSKARPSVTKTRLVLGEINGAGAAQYVAGEWSCIVEGREVRVARVERVGSIAVALWEWVDDDPTAEELREVRFGLWIRFTGGAGLGTARVECHLAPSLFVVHADESGPIPRFAPVGRSWELFSVIDGH